MRLPLQQQYPRNGIGELRHPVVVVVLVAGGEVGGGGLGAAA